MNWDVEKGLVLDIFQVDVCVWSVVLCTPEDGFRGEIRIVKTKKDLKEDNLTMLLTS